MKTQLGLDIFAEVCQQFTRFAKAIPMNTSYCSTFITGAPNLHMNYVYGLDLSNPAGLGKDLAQLRETKIPMILMCAQDLPSPISNLLKEYGLTQIGSAQSKFKSISGEAYTPNPKIQIKAVLKEEDLSTWRKIAATSFDYPYGCDDLLFKPFLQPGKHHEKVKLYLAYINGEAAGQSMLVLCEEAAANMWSSVLPEFRNKGVLTEMIQYRNHIADQAGYAQSIVQCMPMSASVYDKVGYFNEEPFDLYALE